MRLLLFLFVVASGNFSCENSSSLDYSPYGKMIWMGDQIQLGSENQLIKVAFEKDTLIARIDLKGDYNFSCYHTNNEIYIRGNWSPKFGLIDRAEVFDDKGVKRKVYNYYFGRPAGGTTYYDTKGSFVKYEYWDKERKLIEYFSENDSLFSVEGYCPIIITARKLSTNNDSILMQVHTASPPGLETELVYYPEYNFEDSVILTESPNSRENFSLLIAGKYGIEDQLKMKYYLSRSPLGGEVLRECSFFTANPRLAYE